MKKGLISLLAIVFVMSIFAACSGSNSSDNGVQEADSEGKEKQSGKLTVYIGFQEDHAIEAMKQFTEDTGIDVDMIRMSGGEILSKIRAEKGNPQADVWYGGPADTFVAAMKEDLLQPYKSPVAEKIDAEYKDPNGYWTGIYIGALGFISNKEFLENNGLEPPTSWDDLLDPVYKGELVMGNPASSSMAYTSMYTILQVFGEDEGFEYLKKLHEQMQQYTTSGLNTGRMVGMGEAGAGLLFAHDVLKYQEEGFESLVLTIPEDGTGYETGAVAIINNAPNVELAETFIDWALGPSAQEVGQRTGSYQSLTNPDAQQPEKAIDITEINLVDYDPEKAGEERERIIQKWNTEVNK